MLPRRNKAAKFNCWIFSSDRITRRAARQHAAKGCKRFARALAELPEEYRRAIELRYFDGYSLEETAILMGRTTGAVRGLVDRARRQIRESLGRASHYLSEK